MKIAYFPSSRGVAPRPRLGIEMSAKGRGTSAAFVTRPVIVTGFCAGARAVAATTSAARHEAIRRDSVRMSPSLAWNDTTVAPRAASRAGNEDIGLLLSLPGHPTAWESIRACDGRSEGRDVAEALVGTFELTSEWVASVVWRARNRRRNWPPWIRTKIPGSKVRCPAIGRGASTDV